MTIIKLVLVLLFLYGVTGLIFSFLSKKDEANRLIGKRKFLFPFYQVALGAGGIGFF